MSNTQVKVTYRDIAKVLCKGLPVEGAEFGTAVTEAIAGIRKLSKGQREALQCAYIFSSKCPRQERDDLFQDLTLRLLEAKVDNIRLAYSIARCDWIDWWRSFKIKAHYGQLSLDDKIDDDSLPLSEVLIGELDFECRMAAKMDAERLYNKLPSHIQGIVNKRLIGGSITGGDRIMLDKFIAKYPMLLASES